MEDIFTVDDHGTTYYNTDDNYRLERLACYKNQRRGETMVEERCASS